MPRLSNRSDWTLGKAELLSQTAIAGAQNGTAFSSQKEAVPGSYDEVAFVLHQPKVQDETETLPLSLSITDWVADIRKITKELIATEISGSGYEKSREYPGRKHVSNTKHQLKHI